MNYGLVAFILIVVGIVIFLVQRKFKSGVGTLEVERKDSTFEILEIQVPKNMDENRDTHLASLSAENMFASLHGLLKDSIDDQESFSFELVADGATGIKFYTVVPTEIAKFVESQIYAQHPSSQIRVVKDYAQIPEGHFYKVSKITYYKKLFFPIKTYRDFEIDPLSSITSSLSEAAKNEKIWFQISMKPIPDIWQEEGQKYVQLTREGKTKEEKKPNFIEIVLDTILHEVKGLVIGVFVGLFRNSSPEAAKGKLPDRVQQGPVRLNPLQDLEIKSIENKLTKMAFMAEIRLVTVSDTESRVDAISRSFMASLKQFSAPNLNSFTSVFYESQTIGLEDYINRVVDSSDAIIMGVDELATLYHYPNATVDTPNISWLYSKKSEPPSTLPTKDCTYIGETLFRSQKVKFGIANTDDRLRHMYLIGKSGTGKSTLFETMISQDIQNGFGVGVLDPHGETIDKILEYIPDNRIDDVIYFDPSDTEMPIGLNLLEMDDPSQKNLMASGLVAAIKQHFDYSWGPRLEYLLNYAILTLLEVPGTSMLGITRLLEDDNYRKYILHFVKDPIILRFWDKEFRDMKGNQKLVTEAVAPIQNKVNRFLASSTIRNILGQRRSTLNIWDAMNSGKILLLNLSKGKIGSDNSNLLGALIVSRIQFYALQRAQIPYEKRNPFYLYVDEFQNFATGSFEEILSESRKYKLGLYLTHQFTGQLPEPLLKAVYGNVGTIASFALGAEDAKTLGFEFAPYFDQNDIISLERFHIYIKLMIDGMTSLPFSAKILLPWLEDFNVAYKTPNREKVIQTSRQKYGVPREYVEDKISKWVAAPFDKGMAIAQEMKDNANKQ